MSGRSESRSETPRSEQQEQHHLQQEPKDDKSDVSQTYAIYFRSFISIMNPKSRCKASKSEFSIIGLMI
jgi:hypothetical protein